MNRIILTYELTEPSEIYYYVDTPQKGWKDRVFLEKVLNSKELEERIKKYKKFLIDADVPHHVYVRETNGRWTQIS